MLRTSPTKNLTDLFLKYSKFDCNRELYKHTFNQAFRQYTYLHYFKLCHTHAHVYAYCMHVEDLHANISIMHIAMYIYIYVCVCVCVHMPLYNCMHVRIRYT